ncbi:hypothetical protein [Microbacterium sp. 69-7]|uniref:hypothetical protein n=1 Tax=Microbacterium sp. 69-7 TaxID=1895784 RepID=UPI00258A95BC|nr:hypothetical protein [Microbacterium sp. 69-7]
MSTASVVIAHGALAMIGTVALFAVLSRAFIDVELTAFWTTVLAATATGLSGWLSYLSASRMTTQRLTTLLVTFIGIGTLAAMITTSDPMWWTYHFSQLGTFGDMSSFLFNGTLIAGGLLVTTFTLYVSHDLAALGHAASVSSAQRSRSWASCWPASASSPSTSTCCCTTCRRRGWL